MKKHTLHLSKRVVLIIILCGAAGISACFIIRKEMENHRAYVQPVSDVNNDYDSSASPLSGSGIISDQAQQEISLQDGEKVSQVYVKVGDVVKKDQKLFSYDTSSLSLNLQSDQLTLEQAQNTLRKEQKKLSQLADIKAIPDSQKKINADRINMLSQQASQAEQAISDYQTDHADELLQKAFDVDDDPSVIRAQTEFNNFSNGTYTDEEQNQIDSCHSSGDTAGLQTYMITHQKELLQQLTDARASAVQQRKDAYDSFCNGDYSPSEQKQIDSLQAGAKAAEKAYEDAVTTQDNEITETDKASMIRSQQVTVMKAQNSVSAAQADVKATGSRLQDATVKAGMDGTVTELNDAGSSVQEGKPYLVISSAGGVSVIGAVSEFDIHEVRKGDKIKVTDYVSGNESEAEIVSVSTFPDNSGTIFSNSTCNENVTSYPFTAVLKKPDGFNVGDSIDYQPISTGKKILNLSRAYIRMDEKGAYAMIDDGSGHLKRQNLKVTASQHDPQTVSVIKGLKDTDLIAFPYGKNARTGNETTARAHTSLFGF